ncbi:MAG: tyrosine-type recombinase/integrase [Bacteroidota bacterium]
MFLSRSSSGIYYLWYTVDGKKQKVSTRCKFKQDALKFLQAFNIEQTKKVVTKPTVLLQSFVNDYLLFAEGNYAKKTVIICRFSFKNFLSFFGAIPIDTITPKHFDSYKTHRLKSVSPVSVNIELRTIRSALSTAVRWGILNSNPFLKQKLVTVPEVTPIFFGKEDFQKLINAIKENWLKEIVIFAALTGMRRSEITNLNWSEVDLVRKLIKVQSSATFSTKNRKKRILPLNDTALYLLQLKAKMPSSEYVFTHNNAQIAADWLTHKFKYYVYECKFRDDRLHFHSLRHTFASWLVQDGVSIYAIKELLGHSDIKTTQVYSHLQLGLLHDTVNKIRISMN